MHRGQSESYSKLICHGLSCSPAEEEEGDGGEAVA